MVDMFLISTVLAEKQKRKIVAKKPIVVGFFAMISFLTRYCGVPEKIRTPDLLVRSQTLYPAELRAHSISAQRLSIITQAPVKCKPFSEKTGVLSVRLIPATY